MPAVGSTATASKVAPPGTDVRKRRFRRFGRSRPGRSRTDFTREWSRPSSVRTATAHVRARREKAPALEREARLGRFSHGWRGVQRDAWTARPGNVGRLHNRAPCRPTRASHGSSPSPGSAGGLRYESEGLIRAPEATHAEHRALVALAERPRSACRERDASPWPDGNAAAHRSTMCRHGDRP
jgi:hypothetical protein